jgi:hypothetical protein
MTYAEVVALLESVATAAGAAGFYQGPRQAKGVAYNEPFPQAHLYLMPDVVTDTGVKYSVGMGFFGNDQHENGGPDSVAIQSAMDLLSQRFRRLLMEEEEIEIGAQMTRMPVFRAGTFIGTGYYVDFDLTVSPIC